LASLFSLPQFDLSLFKISHHHLIKMNYLSDQTRRILLVFVVLTCLKKNLFNQMNFLLNQLHLLQVISSLIVGTLTNLIEFSTNSIVFLILIIIIIFIKNATFSNKYERGTNQLGRESHHFV
jgi:hypothetical protein